MHRRARVFTREVVLKNLITQSLRAHAILGAATPWSVDATPPPASALRLCELHANLCEFFAYLVHAGKRRLGARLGTA